MKDSVAKLDGSKGKDINLSRNKYRLETTRNSERGEITGCHYIRQNLRAKAFSFDVCIKFSRV